MRAIILIIFLIAPIAQPTTKEKSFEPPTFRVEKKLDAFNDDLDKLIHTLQNESL